MVWILKKVKERQTDKEKMRKRHSDREIFKDC